MKRTGCAVLLLLSTLVSTAEEPRKKGLESYQGKDLQNLNDREYDAFQKEFAAFTGDKIKARELDDLQLWWVKSFKSGNVSWVLLKADPGGNVFSISCIEIHAFDKNWKRLVSQIIPTGWNFALEEEALIEKSFLNQDLLMVKATSYEDPLEEDKKPRSAFERHYYACLNDEFVLVRLEDDKGRIVRNSCRERLPLKGPKMPNRSRDERIRSLNSNNPVEQLATLVWLTGTHRSRKDEREEGWNQESVESSKRFEEVRDAAETKKALHELANSKIPWVKEYAKMPLETPGK